MDKFDFSYSALTEEEKTEVEAVRRSYSQKQDALSKMRVLDKKVRLPAEIAAYLTGVIATLILGTGMCMSMEVIGGGIIAGVIVGVAGIALISFNYKIYRAVLAHRKKKYGAEILRLTEELLKGKKD